MATPTAMKHVASQQGRTPSQLAAATPPVSTPFSNPAHAVFSPRGPRSSPQQFKKSPATTATLMGQPGSNAPLNFDSPSTAAAMGALGIGDGLDIGLENVAALGTLGALATEDDKLKRLEVILEILNKKKGLVSEAGLERLAQRIGLDCLSEEQMVPGKRKTKTLVIAGTAIQLDIVLDNNIVENISLAFPESAPSVIKHADAASRILLEDLQLLPNQSPLTKTLDRFSANLQRLANLDKLSIIPGLDCHEALAGIYGSLERLHQWDIAKIREESGTKTTSESALSNTAMCTRNGYPVMHARDRIGLALQYWRERHNVPPAGDFAKTLSSKQEKVWSLLIGCAPSGDMGHLPVRVSETWISKDIVKNEPSMDPKKPNLDWQEPENVHLPPSEENKDATVEVIQPDLSTARVPQVMFTVEFDPPIILSQNDWVRLYACANMSPPPIFGYPPTFDSLFFPIPPGEPHDPSELRTITHERDIRVFDAEGKPSTKAHRNTLFIYKQIYSQVVTEMPFSHPRQLVDMLPILRQYAFISTLLRNSFESNMQGAAPSKANDSRPQQAGRPNTLTAQDELAEIAGSATADNQQSPASDHSWNLDVTLWVHPTPHLQVVFPFRDSTANVALKVLENAAVEITDEDILPRKGRETTRLKGREITRADLGRVLEHMEDLCKWTEWVCTRLG